MPTGANKNNVPIHNRIMDVVAEFNRKYSTNFDFNKFLEMGNDEDIGWDQAYETSLKELISFNIRERAMGAEEMPSVYPMVKDFEESVIGVYRSSRIEAKKGDFPMEYAGLTDGQISEFINTELKKHPVTAVAVIEQRYKDGMIRIREMVGQARTLSNNLNGIDKKVGPVKTMISYAQALERVNESRSFFWRIFHPFRNHAEKRDARVIREILNDLVAQYDLNRLESEVTEQPAKWVKDDLARSEIEKDKLINDIFFGEDGIAFGEFNPNEAVKENEKELFEEEQGLFFDEKDITDNQKGFIEDDPFEIKEQENSVNLDEDVKENDEQQPIIENKVEKILDVQIFQIGFTPSADPKIFEEQVKSADAIRTMVNNHEIQNKEAYNVIKANINKVKAVMGAQDKENRIANLKEGWEKNDAEFKQRYKEYNPQSLEDVKNLPKNAVFGGKKEVQQPVGVAQNKNVDLIKEQININLEDKKNIPPVSEKVKGGNPPQLNNLNK